MSTATERIKVCLTDARPVNINPNNWPVIATARDWEGQYEFQSFRKWSITVRQKGDAYLVYGWKTSAYECDDNVSHGFRATAKDLIQRIKDVANLIEPHNAESLAQTCINDLPEEEI